MHDRMPAILAPEEYAAWFDAETPLKEAHELLKPHPAELMTAQHPTPAGAHGCFGSGSGVASQVRTRR
jgi:putative SOS response-associated peptidase YedK